MTHQEIKAIMFSIDNLRSYVPYDEQHVVDRIEGDFQNLFQYIASLEKQLRYEQEGKFYARFQSEKTTPGSLQG